MSETFGVLLHEYRMRAGLAQNALARATGINVGTVNRLERDQRLPASRQQVLALTEALELTMAETNQLLDAAGLTAEGFGPSITGNPVICELADMLQDDHIPQGDREGLLTMIDSYIQLMARANGRSYGGANRVGKSQSSVGAQHPARSADKDKRSADINAYQ